MKRKSSYISTDLFVQLFTEHFLIHKTSGKVILSLDGHRAYFSSPILLQTAAENKFTIIILPGDHTRTLQPLDKCLLEPLKCN